MKNILLLTALLLSIATSAAAQTPESNLPPELTAYLSRSDQQGEIKGAMARQWKNLLPECTTPELKGLNVFVRVAPQYNAAKEPISGEWRVVGRVEGCGERRIFSLLYLFTPEGKLTKTSLLPGNTIAGLRLQRDALTYAASAMAKIIKGQCKDYQYSNTSFVKFDDKAAVLDKSPWTEQWTVKACGVTGLVTMHFIPDATGTLIQTSTAETRRIDLK